MHEKNITIAVEISASTEAVFGAISEETELKKWWVDVPLLEKKMGGKMLFRFLKEKSETLTEDFVVGGKIMEFVPNHRLSYTWRPVNDPNYPNTLVTWVLEAIDQNKTKLILLHSGLENAKDASHLEQGWPYFLNRLVELFK
jgi:uncharacterized protein YndB with AHSA1/START domain